MNSAMTAKAVILVKRAAMPAKTAMALIPHRKARKMSTQNTNQSIIKNADQRHPCNQQRPNQPPITDERIKQMIMDTLIELNLVPQVQKKKVLSDV
jgi:hypothetical protein